MTLAPTVDFIDSGELAAVVCTLGIAHPTGYPLFTLLGWTFSHIPVGGEEIVRLNRMAALFCALGVLVFFHVVRILLTIVSERAPALRLGENGHHTRRVLVASAGASLLLAFSETYWSQALVLEVYSLHVLLLLLLLLFFFKAAIPRASRAPDEKRSVVVPTEHWWLVFAFAVGLSFANHMTTILLAPGLLYMYFATNGAARTSWMRLLAMAVPFLLGLSVYLYLPLRASAGPVLNWGNPVTLERFLWHVGGKQFRVWIFESTEAAGRQLLYFVNTLPGEFAYVGLVFCLVGVVTLWRAHRRLGITLVLLFVTCVAYSINYDIHDIDSYFMLSYVSLALMSGVGLLRVIVWSTQRLRWRTPLSSAAVLALCLVPLPYHFAVVDRSKNYLVEDYTHNMFKSLEPQALILSYQWDYWVSASWYYQLVRGIRPDVVVVDKELLRRSWYLLSLERLYPWLMDQSRHEVEAFRKELYKFEHELSYNPAVIQARFVDMIQSFIRRSLPSRPVYVTGEIEPEFTVGLQRVPQGLAFRLEADTLFHRTSFPQLIFRPFLREGRLESMVKKFYADAYVARAVYYYSMARDSLEARSSLRSALRYDPGSPTVSQLRLAIGE